MRVHAAALIPAAGLILLIAGAVKLKKVLRNRPPTEEMEASRREMVNKAGRIIAGQVTDVAEEHLIVYQYDVRGVYYTSTQDIRTLTPFAPQDPWKMLGPITVKYDPHNPANSIIVCEHSSGIPMKKEQRT